MARTRAEVISDMVDSGLFSDDEIRSAVKSAPSAQQTSPNSSFQNYQDSQLGSPQQLLQMIPDIASQLSKKASPYVENRLNQLGANPTVSKIASKVSEYSPDIAMAALDPLAGAQKFIPKLAISAERRALGLASPELKTVFGRGKSAEAARTMIEQGVTSKSGNPQTLFDKATALNNSVGEKIGDIRKSVGDQPINKFIDALDEYKSSRLQGASGGAWDKISSKIEEAKDTIRGLLGKEENPSVQIIKGKSIPGSEGSPLQIIKGSAGKPGTRNPATGFIENEIESKPSVVVGGTSGTPVSKLNDTVVIKNSGSPNIMGGSSPSKNIGLDKIANAKKELGKLVNWFSDNMSQEESKKINGVLEKAIEGSISSSGGDIKTYKALKPIYGATKTALKGLDRELGKQQGNMAVSLPSLVAGASGGPAGLVKMGVFEAAKRRGAGATVPMIMNSPKVLTPMAVGASLPGRTESDLVSPVADKVKGLLSGITKTLTEDKARELLREAKGDREKARKLAKDRGYEIPE